jgi:hypothetical protein
VVKPNLHVHDERGVEPVSTIDSGYTEELSLLQGFVLTLVTNFFRGGRGVEVSLEVVGQPGSSDQYGGNDLGPLGLGGLVSVQLHLQLCRLKTSNNFT